MMFPSAHLQSMTRNGQPVVRQYGTSGVGNPGLCHCGCHAKTKPPPAAEARLCRECADERFLSWNALVDVLMRDD